MIEPHRVADDVGWKPVSAVAGHAVTLPAGGQVDNARRELLKRLAGGGYSGLFFDGFGVVTACLSFN